jgi:plasmid stability protein
MKLFSMYLDKENRKRLEILAAERGLSMGAYIRQIVFEAHQAYLARKGVRKP